MKIKEAIEELKKLNPEWEVNEIILNSQEYSITIAKDRTWSTSS